MNYGSFSEDGSEYRITTPKTPAPWINYLTNGDYCALCSHVGGGFSFFRDHRYHAVLERGMHQSTDDLPGRFIYIKDEETGEIWNANAHPIQKYDSFESCHRPGETHIRSQYSEVGADIRYVVDPDVQAESWRISVSNPGDRPRKLSVYTHAAICLGNVSAFEGAPEFNGLCNRVVRDDHGFVVSNTFWFSEYGWSEVQEPWPYEVYHTTTRPPDRLCLDRYAFIGPMRSWQNPQGIESEWLPEAEGSGRQIAAVCQWRIQLDPGENWDVALAVGIQPADGDPEQKQKEIESWREPSTHQSAGERSRTTWDQLISPVQVETPDQNINRMMNTWNKIQLAINFSFGRSPSFYHKGQYPAMRDSCQDAFGMLPLSAEKVRDHLLRIGGFFFSDGQACGGCNRIGLPEGRAEKVDLPLWFVMSVADYIRETGDWEFLEETVSLMDGGTSTVFENMIRGIDRMIDQRGPHGLPLMGKGDWNDAANGVGKKGQGESVWLAQFLYFILQEMIPILERNGDPQRLKYYSERSEELRKIVNADCWDGDWFVRAFRDDGRPLGVKNEKEGFIWINSQTWAVISRIADDERLRTCMESVEEHMGTPYGLTNLAPAYTSFDPSIGLITGLRAGWKENAAVFSHASSFNVVARAMLGMGASAVDLYRRILPSSKDAGHYRMEPYVYSQFCAGPGAGEDQGEGAYHWLTGTAAWMFRSMLDYILGVRAEYEGLRIDPAVDPSWKTFRLKRSFRGAEYDIQFENPDGVETGVKMMLLDGNEVTGTRLPLPTQKTHEVKVLMGVPES